jgi:hypothetical protein
MSQFDVLFTGRRESDGVLSDVFDCGCKELRVNLSGRGITVFGGQSVGIIGLVSARFRRRGWSDRRNDLTA